MSRESHTQTNRVIVENYKNRLTQNLNEFRNIKGLQRLKQLGRWFADNPGKVALGIGAGALGVAGYNMMSGSPSPGTGREFNINSLNFDTGRQSWRDQVRAANEAKRERKAQIETEMAQSGSDYKTAVAKLKQDKEFNKLSAEARRFATQSSASTSMHQAAERRADRLAQSDAADRYRKDYLEQPSHVRQHGGRRAFDARKAEILDKWDEESGRAAERAMVDRAVNSVRTDAEDEVNWNQRTVKVDGVDTPTTEQEREGLLAGIRSRAEKRREQEYNERGLTPWRTSLPTDLPPAPQPSERVQQVADQMPTKKRNRRIINTPDGKVIYVGEKPASPPSSSPPSVPPTDAGGYL